MMTSESFGVNLEMLHSGMEVLKAIESGFTISRVFQTILPEPHVDPFKAKSGLEGI